MLKSRHVIPQFAALQNRKSTAFDIDLSLVEISGTTHKSNLPILMLHIIWSIIIGFIAGAIASMIMHTHLDCNDDPGTIGSIVGGIIARLFETAGRFLISSAGLILSIIGAIIVLFIAGKMA
jgi:uncharacterized membrane protein YeaQ/YmgE (transglycosylase-associated protein family)